MTAAAALTEARRWRGIVCVLASMGVIGVNVGLFHPLIALNLEARGHSTTVIGLNAATPFIAAILCAPLLPRLAAGLGLTRVLILAALIDIAAVLGFVVVDHVAGWFVLRFVMGIGMLMHWAGSEIWINAAVTDEHRGKIFGLNGALFSAGMACGPIVLGTVGIGGAAPFLLSAAILAVSGAPLLFAFGCAPEARHERSTNLRAAIRRAPTAMLSGLVQGIVVMALFSQLPIWGVRQGMAEASAIALLTALVIGGAVAPLPIGWLADHVNRRLLLILCGAVLFVMTLLLPLVAANPAALWAVLLVWGGAGSGLYTLSLVRLGEVFRPEQLGAATSAYVMVTHIGSIAGPVLLGTGMDLWDAPGLVMVTAAAALGLTLFGLWRFVMRPERRWGPGRG